LHFAHGQDITVKVKKVSRAHQGLADGIFNTATQLDSSTAKPWLGGCIKKRARGF
jgi:hypothetical protein